MPKTTPNSSVTPSGSSRNFEKRVDDLMNRLKPIAVKGYLPTRDFIANTLGKNYPTVVSEEKHFVEAVKKLMNGPNAAKEIANLEDICLEAGCAPSVGILLARHMLNEQPSAATPSSLNDTCIWW